MKKFIAVLLISISFMSCTVAHAAESYYINVDPYPYSSHILGEDLVVYGDTNATAVVLGLYSLRDNGSVAAFLYSSTVFRSELKNGYSIPTSRAGGSWKEGDYLLVLQYGPTKSESIIHMSYEPVYDRNVIICEYSDNTLINSVSYRCRGIAKRNGIYEIALQDGSSIKIFFWNNFVPTENGEATVFISANQDGYMTSAKHYRGFLSSDGNRFTMKLENGGELKLFLWNDSLNPVNRIE